MGWVYVVGVEVLTLPYGKFVHALHRFATLAHFHIERRPLPGIGSK